MSCFNQAYYRKLNGKMRTEEEVEEYMKSLPQIPPPPHNEENKDIVEIINNNKVFLKYYKEQQEEIERLNNIINRTTKYVQSLSSKGRGCDIYEDIKQEILKELKGE